MGVVSTSYLTVPEFKTLTVMPSEDVDELETFQPGFLLAQLQVHTAKLNSRLAKRYAVPFASPCPDVVRGWLAAQVTPLAYRRRGVNASDAQFELVEKDRDLALKEIEEAANSETGLFDLPLKEGLSASGISMGSPLGYAEPGPYEWTDVQREAVRGR